MATIKLTGATFYKKGVSGASTVVGMDGGDATRVARYTITPPAEGAMGFTLSFQNKQLGEKNEYYDEIPIRYYIGTSDSSHANADGNYEYTGELTRGSNDTFTGTANVMLLPGQTYYLWVFPGKVAGPGVYCWYYWTANDSDSLTTTGSAGLVYIGNGSTFEAYEIWIGNGTAWERYIPYIGDGSQWVLCG